MVDAGLIHEAQDLVDTHEAFAELQAAENQHLGSIIEIQRAVGAADLNVDAVMLLICKRIQALSGSTVDALVDYGAGKPSLGIDTRDAAAILSELAYRGLDLGNVGAVVERRAAASSREAVARALTQLTARRPRPSRSTS